jgi:hypothetical protein
MAILIDEDDAGRFEGGAYVINCTGTKRFAPLESSDGICRDLGSFSKFSDTHLNGRTSHPALRWQQFATPWRFRLDVAKVFDNSYIVAISPHGATEHPK